jgi:hypothetical protein
LKQPLAPFVLFIVVMLCSALIVTYAATVLSNNQSTHVTFTGVSDYSADFYVNQTKLTGQSPFDFGSVPYGNLSVSVWVHNTGSKQGQFIFDLQNKTAYLPSWTLETDTAPIHPMNQTVLYPGLIITGTLNITVNAETPCDLFLNFTLIPYP